MTRNLYKRDIGGFERFKGGGIGEYEAGGKRGVSEGHIKFRERVTGTSLRVIGRRRRVLRHSTSSI